MANCQTNALCRPFYSERCIACYLCMLLTEVNFCSGVWHGVSRGFCKKNDGVASSSLSYNLCANSYSSASAHAQGGR